MHGRGDGLTESLLPFLWLFVPVLLTWIVTATDLHLEMVEVGTDGGWTTPEPIAVPRIRQIQFGTHYVRTFLKYALPRTP